MHVSGCLYALEQFACALSLLTASGLACGLRRLHPARLMLLAALASLACTFCAVLALAWLRWVLLPLTLLLPLTAWPGAPRPSPICCATVELMHQGHIVTLTALVDTGNLLRDPLTGLPVIVVSRQAARKLTSLPAPGQLLPGMRLISVRTAAGSALMAIFRPQRVRVLSGQTWREVRAMVGLSPDGYEGAQALLPACLTEDAFFFAS